MSADPMTGSLSDPQRFDKYAYVSNRPTTMVDPSGLTNQPISWDVSINDSGDFSGWIGNVIACWMCESGDAAISNSVPSDDFSAFEMQRQAQVLGQFTDISDNFALGFFPDSPADIGLDPNATAKSVTWGNTPSQADDAFGFGTIVGLFWQAENALNQ